MNRSQGESPRAEWRGDLGSNYQRGTPGAQIPEGTSRPLEGSVDKASGWVGTGNVGVESTPCAHPGQALELESISAGDLPCQILPAFCPRQGIS